MGGAGADAEGPHVPAPARATMRSRVWRIGARLLGVALIALVVWLVGWKDEVRAADGSVHRGRVVRVAEDVAVLRVDAGEERTIPIASPDDVERGLGSAFAHLLHAPGFAALAVLALLASACCAQVRWHVLLRGAGLETPLREAFRLGWIGLFFNQVLPAGQVGGDLVKAYFIARRHAGRRTMAVVSVLADRGLGLFVICLAAAVGVLFAPAGSRIQVAKTLVLAFFAFSTVFLGLLLLPGVRRRLPVSRLLARLPLGRVWVETARSFDAYGRRPRVVALAFLACLLVHATFLLCFAALGPALGADVSLFALLVAIPVASAAGSIPGLPAGWGVGDMAFWFFLPAAGIPAGTAVALSFTFRVVYMLISLPGGLLFARAGPRKDEIEEAMGAA